MSLSILFHFLCAQHVSDINISINYPSSGACDCVIELPHRSFCSQPHQISNTQRTENKMTDVVIQQHSRKLLMMDILISETCSANKKWNKIESDIKLVFYSSTITMMHGPINISLFIYVEVTLESWGKWRRKTESRKAKGKQILRGTDKYVWNDM